MFENYLCINGKKQFRREEAYWKMMHGEDLILCPKCYAREDAE